MKGIGGALAMFTKKNRTLKKRKLNRKTIQNTAKHSSPNPGNLAGSRKIFWQQFCWKNKHTP